MKDTTCTSCGRRIPLGQGRSCSYCYGDPFYGRDGYLLEAMERDRQEQELREQGPSRDG